MSGAFQAVKIFDTHVEVTVNGVEKLLSHIAFKEMYDRVMEKDSTVMTTMILPSNVIAFGKTASTIEINTYWPEALFDVSFKPDRWVNAVEKLRIPFPNILLYFHLTMQGDVFNVSRAKYFCTSKKPGQLFQTASFIREPDSSMGVHPLALPNIFGECRACYGANTMPGGFKDDFRGIDWYYLFLHQSTFNTDLTIPGVSGSSMSNPSNWMKHLSTLDAFPYKLLR